MSLADRPLAGDEVQGAAAPVARNQNADLLQREAALTGRTAPFAGPALQFARALFGLEKVGLVRFRDALQALRAVVLDPCEEAMTPPKAGVAMHAARARGLSHRLRREHLLQKIEPLALVPQPGQWRAGERIERLATRPTAVTLQAIGLSMPVNPVMPAVRAFRRRLEVALNASGRFALAAGLPQRLNQPGPLPGRQLADLSEQLLEHRRLHARLPSANTEHIDSVGGEGSTDNGDRAIFNPGIRG